MEIDIEQYLLRLGNERLSYIPNPGNAGDSLIASGTFHLFDRLGLNYFVASQHRSNYAGEVVLYGGGGNLGKMTNVSARFLSRIHRQPKRLIVLPHTIKEIDPLLRDFGSNVTLICRETSSFDYVKRINETLDVKLADDLALKADVGQLLKFEPSKWAAARLLHRYLLGKSGLVDIQPPQFESIRKLLSINQKLQLLSTPGSGVLNAFRLDGEKTDIAIPDDNIDVSEELSIGVESPELAHITSHVFLTFLNRFQKINTNRLHVAVGAALLGKEVQLYANNYFKVRAVYEYSLRKFTNLSFVG
jgi:exopolysaccharide biosynthesis predicted pyruvyltransferase EpsI